MDFVRIKLQAMTDNTAVAILSVHSIQGTMFIKSYLKNNSFFAFSLFFSCFLFVDDSVIIA